MFNRLILLSIIFSLLYSNIDYNISYVMKYADGEDQSSDYFENFYDINMFYNDLYIYSLLKYGKPITGYKALSFNDMVKSFYIEYSSDEIDYIFGDIYTVYGRGLSLYSFNDRDIDYDNSVRGLSMFYSKSVDNNILNYIVEDAEFYSLIGENAFEARSNPADILPNIMIDNKLLASGVTFYKNNYDFYYSFHLNNQYLKKETILEMAYFGNFLGNYLTNSLQVNNNIDDFEMNIVDHNFGGNFYIGDLEISFEHSKVYYNKIHGERVSGYRTYFSSNFDVFDFNVLYEYKDYNTPFLYSVFSNPPTCFKETNSALISRNLHSIDFSNEVGHQIVIDKSFSNISLNINYAFAHKHLNIIDNSIDEPGILDIFNNMFQFSDIEEFSEFLPYRQLYLEINGWTDNKKLFYKIGYDNYSEYINTDSPSTVEGNEYVFMEPNKIIKASTIPSQFSYVLNSGNSISLYLESQNLEYENLNDLYTSLYLVPSIHFNNKYIFSIFYDTEKGSLNDGSKTSKNWIGTDLTYYISDTDIVSIFMGSQKGGLVCANGTCVQQPDFDKGIKVTFRSMF